MKYGAFTKKEHKLLLPPFLYSAEGTLSNPSRRRRGQWPALREKDSLVPFQVNPKGHVPKEVREPSPFNKKETKERIPTPFSAPTTEEKSPTVKPRAFPVTDVGGWGLAREEVEQRAWRPRLRE
ncbi:hypothetical protein ES332_A12G050300v1 [Gossypium tomentosum]|uniref:Uncharacterized protein n=1 Tax=Gossypium tomentosum TaxID=34277 RepID=A0A5D2MTP7_GOSTO|nr:hypothetical protein ES332_A12G050300v1 [Gossypium tomentosum]